MRVVDASVGDARHLALQLLLVLLDLLHRSVGCDLDTGSPAALEEQEASRREALLGDVESASAALVDDEGTAVSPGLGVPKGNGTDGVPRGRPAARWIRSASVQRAARWLLLGARERCTSRSSWSRTEASSLSAAASRESQYSDSLARPQFAASTTDRSALALSQQSSSSVARCSALSSLSSSAS